MNQFVINDINQNIILKTNLSFPTSISISIEMEMEIEINVTSRNAEASMS
jgi:hypothetical protein